MRARLIFCTFLALGALLTVSVGAGFAQKGLDDSTSAGQQQYGKGKPEGRSLGEIESVPQEEESDKP